MTELLDSHFFHLPTPKPKTHSEVALKKSLRLNMLRMVGRTFSSRSDATRRTKILLVRPDHLGDLIFLTPALRYLRDLLPQVHLSLMVGPWGQAVMENSPYIDELLICKFPGFTRQPKKLPWQPYRYLYQQAKVLKQRQFDVAAILRFDHWWGAWLAAAAGIPRRFGYDIPEVTPFLTDPLPYDEGRHEVEQNWRLAHYTWSMGTLAIIDAWSDAETMGDLMVPVSKEGNDWAERWLQEHHILEERPLIVIHPGAGAPVKLWRNEAWAELGQILMDQHQCQLVLSGGPDEVALCREIAAKLKPEPPVAAGQMTLPQLAGLMSYATLALGPDTGPLKLAAAVGIPTVELYGPVAVQKFGPWRDRTQQRSVTSGLGCIACNHLDYRTAELSAHFCVRGLSVEWVLQEVVDLLKQTM